MTFLLNIIRKEKNQIFLNNLTDCRSCPDNQFLIHNCKDHFPKSTNIGVIIGATMSGLLFALVIIIVGLQVQDLLVSTHSSQRQVLVASKVNPPMSIIISSETNLVLRIILQAFF